MSKHKQKYVLMQKNIPTNTEVMSSNGRNRPIPKNPLSINKKLALLKQNHSEDRNDSFAPTSRNQSSKQATAQRINQIQSSESSIANFGGRRQSEQSQNLE